MSDAFDDLPATTALFSANSERLDGLVNGDGYTSTGGVVVPGLPTLLADVTAGASAAEAASGVAQAAATTASAAAQASLTNGETYPDIATGLAATADNGYFDVVGDNVTTASNRYQRLSSTSYVLVASFPSAAIVALVKAFVDSVSTVQSVTNQNWLLAAKDTLNTVAFGVDLAGVTRAADFQPLTTTIGGCVITGGNYNYTWCFKDAAGTVILGMLNGQLVGAGLGGDYTTSYSPEEIDARNAQNLAYSQKLKTQINTNFQGLAFDYNIFITFGQSLSNGFRSFPGLTTVLRSAGLFMLGGSVRPIGVRSGTAFSPVGGASTLQPLKAVVQDFSGNLITDYSTLDPTGGGLGETMSEAQAAFVKIMMARRAGQPDIGGPQIVVVNCGVDGKSVEQLSKGASTNYYNRVIDAVTQIKAIATAAGKTCGVTLLNWNQGEYNYNGTGTTDKATYEGLVTTLISNLQTDIAAITGQTLPFLTLIGQSGANWTVDSTGLSIGTAQLELSQTLQNVRLATPYYHLPVKSDGHFEANGARWYSCLYGKVAYRMLRGEDWQPLSVRKVTYRGRQVLIDLIVPEPPIKFALPYVGDVQMDFATKGFSLSDSTGYMLPSAVSIASDTQILLTLPRDVTGALSLLVADKTTHQGRTCVQDSDSLIAMESYYYAASNGQAASENITALLNNPYPMNNWLAAGKFTVVNE